MLDKSFLLSTVDLKAAQKVAHSIMSPLNVGTLMVGRSDLLLEEQQDLSDDEVGRDDRVNLCLAVATSAAKVGIVSMQASSYPFRR